MNQLADTVQRDLLAAIERDDLVLPTMPEVALKIREAAEDDNVSVNRLSQVIGQDAALSARLLKVVNSPLLRASFEVTDVRTAINRLGVNYSSNLAIGLVIEQIFHARAPAVQSRMREAWRTSLEVAGMCTELARRFTSLKPDRAALAGLVHQIGVLPILTYAQERNELLSDPVCLSHVIEHIHPRIGDRILRKWDFPAMLAKVPGQFLDLNRDNPETDYGDLVMIATLLRLPHNTGLPTLVEHPAYQRLEIKQSPVLLASDLMHAQTLLS